MAGIWKCKCGCHPNYPNHKALLFKVGSDVDVPDGETLVRGKTFAQSRDVKSIAAELKSLLK